MLRLTPAQRGFCYAIERLSTSAHRLAAGRLETEGVTTTAWPTRASSGGMSGAQNAIVKPGADVAAPASSACLAAAARGLPLRASRSGVPVRFVSRCRMLGYASPAPGQGDRLVAPAGGGVPEQDDDRQAEQPDDDASRDQPGRNDKRRHGGRGSASVGTVLKQMKVHPLNA
jgi:hypothetical protein